MGSYLSSVVFWNIINSLTAMSVSLLLFIEVSESNFHLDHTIYQTNTIM